MQCYEFVFVNEVIMYCYGKLLIINCYVKNASSRTSIGFKKRIYLSLYRATYIHICIENVWEGIKQTVNSDCLWELLLGPKRVG